MSPNITAAAWRSDARERRAQGGPPAPVRGGGAWEMQMRKVRARGATAWQGPWRATVSRRPPGSHDVSSNHSRCHGCDASGARFVRAAHSRWTPARGTTLGWARCHPQRRRDSSRPAVAQRRLACFTQCKLPARMARMASTATIFCMTRVRACIQSNETLEQSTTEYEIK